MRVAQIQAHVYADKNKNIDELSKKIKGVEDQKVDFVTLGELFNCPHVTDSLADYAESEGGPTWTALSQIAADNKIYLSAGSIPEIDKDGKLYNTAYVFDRSGRQIAKHRKVHLFDADIENGQHYHESDVLTPGDQCTIFDTEFGKMGICICFDCRFPEFFRLIALGGAKVIFVPSAFNMTTGPAHWETLLRSRGIDNQCYIVATSDARDETAGYVAWGYSMIVSPWGNIVCETNEKEQITVTDLDLGYVDRIREQLPLISARRTDLYEVRMLK